MSEIRSTLEIALERTKHLTLSEEERAEQGQRDYTAKVKGFMQKYCRGLIKKAQAKEELTALQDHYGRSYRPMVVTEAGSLIRLVADNSASFAVLKDLCDTTADGLRQLCADYANRLSAIRRRSQEEALETLAKEQGISGSAIVPNVEAHPHLRRRMEEVREEFSARVKEEINRLIRG